MRERRDALTAVFTRLALLIAGGILVGLGIATAQYLALNKGFARRLPMTDEIPPAPVLQAAPRQDLERVRREQERRLEGYEWSDRGRRWVRVPVERAMELLLEDVPP